MACSIHVATICFLDLPRSMETVNATEKLIPQLTVPRPGWPRSWRVILTVWELLYTTVASFLRCTVQEVAGCDKSEPRSHLWYASIGLSSEFHFESKCLVIKLLEQEKSEDSGPGPPLPRFVDHFAANQQTWSPRRRQTSSDRKSHTTSITTIHNISRWSNHTEKKIRKIEKKFKTGRQTRNRHRVNESRSRLKNKMTEGYGDQGRHWYVRIMSH